MIVKERFLLSGEAARRAGVSADTLRHYERRGLIPAPPRSANGYRAYPPEVVGVVRIVRRALAVGFTLAELAALFRIRAKGGHPCREVRDLAQVKLRLVEERLKMLKRLRSDLRRLLQDWDRRLRSTPRGKPAHLLASLDSEHDRSQRRSGSSISSQFHFQRTSLKKEKPS